MKVLQILDTINRGGAETQVLDICRNASRFGLEITLVTAQGGAMEEDFRRSGVDYIKLRRRFPADFRLAARLREIISGRKIEIAHGYQAVDGVHLYLATRGLKNVRRVLSFQGGVAPDWKNRRAIRFLIPRMDANVVVSKGLKKWHAEIDAFDTSKFHVVYNGADTRRLLPTGKDLRAELHLPPDALLIGMIGNFYRDPRKDQLTICRALPRVFEKFPNAHCIFAGRTETGAEEKFTECVELCRANKIQGKVHFLGGRNDVPDVLAALDAFVFSSLHEGLPVAMSEAMLARVPLVVSDIEPLLEASGGGAYAEVFPVRNAEILSEKIIKLLGDEEMRHDLSDRAYEFAKNKFSVEAHLENLKNLYEKLLRQSPSQKPPE